MGSSKKSQVKSWWLFYCPTSGKPLGKSGTSGQPVPSCGNKYQHEISRGLETGIPGVGIDVPIEHHPTIRDVIPIKGL